VPTEKIAWRQRSASKANKESFLFTVITDIFQGWHHPSLYAVANANAAFSKQSKYVIKL